MSIANIMNASELKSRKKNNQKYVYYAIEQWDREKFDWEFYGILLFISLNN